MSGSDKTKIVFVKDDEESENKDEQNKEEDIECAICLNPCMQPVQLPCSHTFCFLCAKVNVIHSFFCMSGN